MSIPPSVSFDLHSLTCVSSCRSSPPEKAARPGSGDGCAAIGISSVLCTYEYMF